MDELRHLDEVAYVRFASVYRSFRDIAEFMSELKELLDDPTRGIDVGAKEDVYELVRDMTSEGLAVILLGDTLEEVIGRVFREGRPRSEA